MTRSEHSQEHQHPPAHYTYPQPGTTNPAFDPWSKFSWHRWSILNWRQHHQHQGMGHPVARGRRSLMSARPHVLEGRSSPSTKTRVVDGGCVGKHDPSWPGSEIEDKGAQQVRRQDLVQQQDPVEYSGDPGECDGCGRPLRDEHFLAEVCLPAHARAWGYLCWVCTQVDQVRPGWGQAQFYERRKHNTGQHGPAMNPWRCTAGGPPASKQKQQGGQACG